MMFIHYVLIGVVSCHLKSLKMTRLKDKMDVKGAVDDDDNKVS